MLPPSSFPQLLLSYHLAERSLRDTRYYAAQGLNNLLPEGHKILLKAPRWLLKDHGPEDDKVRPVDGSSPTGSVKSCKIEKASKQTSEKLKSIMEFPRPKNIHELRLFNGMGHFSIELSEAQGVL